MTIHHPDHNPYRHFTTRQRVKAGLTILHTAGDLRDTPGNRVRRPLLHLLQHIHNTCIA